jgi:hypothetical protein
MHGNISVGIGNGNKPRVRLSLMSIPVNAGNYILVGCHLKCIKSLWRLNNKTDVVSGLVTGIIQKIWRVVI